MMASSSEHLAEETDWLLEMHNLVGDATNLIKDRKTSDSFTAISVLLVWEA